VFFVTMNLDRIYFPAVISLQLLGIFAIARTITDIVNAVFIRLNNSILFPHIAAEAGLPREQVRRDIGAIRLRFLAASALAVGGLAGSADLLVNLLFDHRYHAAGWMASILTVGVWFAVLASTAESSLLGLSRPQAASFSNGAKLVWLVVALPLAVSVYGMVAAIAAISASDVVRYLATIPQQRRASFAFLGQDAAATAILFGVIGLVALARSALNLPFLL
jgi:O-antigen/teichoic acid export membrane protein